MRVAVMGAGCVGSVLAEHYYKQDSDSVKLIAVGKRAVRLREKGIFVNGKQYNIAIAEETDKEKPELLFMCVKNYQLEQACREADPYIDEKTVILPLLNSISPTPTIKAAFPENRVLYGYISRIDAHREGEGIWYNISGDIHFGDADNKEIDGILARIQESMTAAGLHAVMDEDMIRGIWKKWMLNIGANQVSALTGADYLQFAEIPEIEKILRLSMQELLVIACYEKVNLGTHDIAELIEYLTTYPYPKQTSMLQDILAERPTEVDYISGDIIRLSHKWNCPCPINLAMYYLIKAKEKTYSAKE